MENEMTTLTSILFLLLIPLKVPSEVIKGEEKPLQASGFSAVEL